MKLPRSAAFLKNVDEAVKELFAATTDLPTFLATAGELSLADRRLIVEQALVLLEMTYVHLPLKRAMHAVDPIQRLKLLQYRLAEMTEETLPDEIQFHNELTDIFTSTRDLHTNYSLPAPFNSKTAFLPFLIEEYIEDGQRKYLVSKLIAGFTHPTFKPGVEVLYWNGIPIRRAVEVNAERQAGSNVAARFARGLDALTIRPMVRVLPPDEEWVVIGYRDLAGKKRQHKQDWLVFSPEMAASGLSLDSASAETTALAIDIQTDAIHQAKKVLFAPQAVAAEKRIEETAVQRAAPAEGVATTMPTVFRARSVTTAHGAFAYVRIFTFNVDEADAFVAEFVRLLASLPQNGLILDVRGNGGGLIYASERLLQVLTPRAIEPERAQFINTPLMLEICRRHGPSPLSADFDLSPWTDSIAQSVATGATYSLGHTITSPSSCNAIGQKYHGPVVLITDALCYSATDIFAAGFQDHEIGPILGTSGNTGAGGANVWTHQLLQILMSEPTGSFTPSPNSPFKPLPNSADMRVAIRRTLRVGERAGVPVEDLGIVPDYHHQLTKADLLDGNADLINRAAEILASRPLRQLSVAITSVANDTLTAVATTQNVARLDVFLDGRPQQSVDVSDGSVQIDVKLPAAGAAALELRGFEGDELVASCRTRLSQ
jgi:hypothetical protein